MHIDQSGNFHVLHEKVRDKVTQSTKKSISHGRSLFKLARLRQN